jgi:hypothetical protein
MFAVAVGTRIIPPPRVLSHTETPAAKDADKFIEEVQKELWL